MGRLDQAIKVTDPCLNAMESRSYEIGLWVGCPIGSGPKPKPTHVERTTIIALRILIVVSFFAGIVFSIIGKNIHNLPLKRLGAVMLSVPAIYYCALGCLTGCGLTGLALTVVNDESYSRMD